MSVQRHLRPPPGLSHPPDRRLRGPETLTPRSPPPAPGAHHPPLPSLRTRLPRAPHTRGIIPYLSLGGRRLSSRSTHVLKLRPGRSGVGAALVLKAESSPTARWSFLCRPLGSRCRGHGWARVSSLRAPALSSSGDRLGRGVAGSGLIFRRSHYVFFPIAAAACTVVPFSPYLL